MTGFFYKHDWVGCVAVETYLISYTSLQNLKWPVIAERYINDCEKWFKTLPIVSRYLLYIMYTESESKTKGKQGPFSFIFTS